MESVPNCQKEIPVHDAIRWFKCKLKPPKNVSTKYTSNTQEYTLLFLQ